MRMRRLRRRRSLTKAQAQIQEVIDRNTRRQCVLLSGIADALPRIWDLNELRFYLDLIATDVIPIMRDNERLEQRLRGRTRKGSKSQPIAKKSPKNKGKEAHA